MSKTLADLKAAYDSLPAIECKKLCYEYCGAIAMFRTELREARKIHPVEARPTIDGYYQPTYSKIDGACSLLDRETNLCKIYAARPGICRIFGLVKKLACPHGCLPSWWLTDEEAAEFLAKIERAGR